MGREEKREMKWNEEMTTERQTREGLVDCTRLLQTSACRFSFGLTFRTSEIDEVETGISLGAILREKVN